MSHPKMNVMASSGNIQRRDFKSDTEKLLCVGGSLVDYQQIDASKSVVEYLEYAIDDLFAHRIERLPSWKMR